MAELIKGKEKTDVQAGPDGVKAMVVRIPDTIDLNSPTSSEFAALVEE